jgi:RNA polymerase nonessential primary-like sigma factor
MSKKKVKIEDAFPVALAVTNKYASLFPRLERAELLAEAQRGVLEASLKYDPDKNASFTTYAWFWAVKNVQEYITRDIDFISLPQNVKAKIVQIKRLSENFEKGGKTASIAELAAELDMTEADVEDTIMSGGFSKMVSLDKQVETNSDSSKISDFIEDKTQRGTFEQLIKESEIARLNESLNCLTPDERQALSLKFGLEGKGENTLKAIAEKMGLSGAKARDLEIRALSKLKKMLKDKDS